MIKQHINSDWQDIIASSEKLLRMAKESLWNDMVEIAQQRDQVIRRYFEHNPVNDDSARQYQNRINQLIKIDQQIAQLQQAARIDLSDEFNEFRKANKAATAYQNCP
ncbi:MAG: flagellar protein FliT [Gammaproteobacteria bacterium]|nr:flagellar protein FliT [Gammaproteobacteria bacterium]